MGETVFVSHASHDREIVERRLLPVLRQAGLTIWYSRHDLQSATHFQSRIREALEKCEWFLVALSPHSVASRWVQAEVALAMDRLPDRVVPVVIDSCDPSQCRLQLKLYQHIDLIHHSEDAYRKLRRTFGSRTSDPKDAMLLQAIAATVKLGVKLIVRCSPTPADRQLPM